MCDAMSFMKSRGTLFPTRAHPGQIPGPQHRCAVKSGVAAVRGSPKQTGTGDMMPTIRNLGGTMGRLQCKAGAYFDYTQPPSPLPKPPQKGVLSLRGRLLHLHPGWMGLWTA